MERDKISVNSGNVQAAWNNRDFDISSTKTALVLLLPAWALGLVIMARYR